MSQRHTAFTGRTLTFVLPQVLVCFQKRPGIHTDRVMIDVGPGRFSVVGKGSCEIHAHEGVYALPLSPTDTGTFELLDTLFRVEYRASDQQETSSAAAIVCWQTPFARTCADRFG